MTENGKRTTAKKILFAFITVFVFVAVFFGGFFTHRLVMGEKVNTVAKVIKAIDDHYCYYDEETGTYREFSAEDYVKLITSGLDRFSRYYTETEYRETVSTDKGNFFGFGATFLRTESLPKIFGVNGNSPFYKSGIRAGDILLGGRRESKEKETFLSKTQAMEFMAKVNENEKVTFYIEREGEFSEREFSVTKKIYVESYVFYYDNDTSLTFISEGSAIPQKAVGLNDSGITFDNNTAYIILSQFSGNAASEFATAMNYMKERGKTKLIFDLRNNGGGFMTILSEISSYLLYGDTKKPLISYAVYKNGTTESFLASGDNFNRDITSIAVIANENTASASEALIGAMLYYKKGFDTTKLVIEKNSEGVAKTYGKGIMQTTFAFLEGDAIKLTTAYIYQPDKATCINNSGITTTNENSVDSALSVSRAKAVV